MARDDYYKIVYNILVYLYTCLKNGEDVQGEMLEYNSPIIEANNKKYWYYIMMNMLEFGFIKNLRTAKVDGAEPLILSLQDVEITPLGIDYLFENNLQAKAKKAMNTTLKIISVVKP